MAGRKNTKSLDTTVQRKRDIEDWVSVLTTLMAEAEKPDRGFYTESQLAEMLGYSRTGMRGILARGELEGKIEVKKFKGRREGGKLCTLKHFRLRDVKKVKKAARRKR
jgi:hypothetical protein